jgi:hypothetical protein
MLSEYATAVKLLVNALDLSNFTLVVRVYYVTLIVAWSTWLVLVHWVCATRPVLSLG